MLWGVNGVASSITIDNSFNLTDAAIFLMKDYASLVFSQFISSAEASWQYKLNIKMSRLVNY